MTLSDGWAVCLVLTFYLIGVASGWVFRKVAEDLG